MIYKTDLGILKCAWNHLQISIYTGNDFDLFNNIKVRLVLWWYQKDAWGNIWKLDVPLTLMSWWFQKYALSNIWKTW